uniref:AAA domain-containing protein n=1 Tax=Macrostomum lignano TaxID=282301 RepID=A0A1I8FD52_9PLAT
PAASSSSSQQAGPGLAATVLRIGDDSCDEESFSAAAAAAEPPSRGSRRGSFRKCAYAHGSPAGLFGRRDSLRQPRPAASLLEASPAEAGPGSAAPVFRIQPPGSTLTTSSAAWTMLYRVQASSRDVLRRPACVPGRLLRRPLRLAADRAGLGSASLLSSLNVVFIAVRRRASGPRDSPASPGARRGRQRPAVCPAALNANASAVSAFERRLGGASAHARWSRRLAPAQPGGRQSAGTGPVGVPSAQRATIARRRSCLPVVVDVDTPTPIGRLRVGAAAAWPDVAAGARRLLREFAVRVDPPGGLGLGADSVAACLLVASRLWRQRRFVDFNSDDALPAAGGLCLPTDGGSRRQPLPAGAWSCATSTAKAAAAGGSSLDALAFATLVPKRCCSGTSACWPSTVGWFCAARLALIGAPGRGKKTRAFKTDKKSHPSNRAGKTFLARRLARHMARLERRRSDDDEEADVSGAVAEFSGELRRSEQELRGLPGRGRGAVSRGNRTRKRPSRGVQVLLLDSLQHLGPLAEARSGLAASRLYIICTLRGPARSSPFGRQRLVAEASQRRPNTTPSRRGGTNLTTGCPGLAGRVNSFLEARGGGPDATVGPGPRLRLPAGPGGVTVDWFVQPVEPLAGAKAASSILDDPVLRAEDWETQQILGSLQRAVWIVVVLVRMLQAVQMVLRGGGGGGGGTRFDVDDCGGCGGGGGSRWISGLCGRQLCQFRCRCCISVDSMSAVAVPAVAAGAVPAAAVRRPIWPSCWRSVSTWRMYKYTANTPENSVNTKPITHRVRRMIVAVHVFLIAGNAGRGLLSTCLADAADVQHNADEQAETFGAGKCMDESGMASSSPENTNRAPLMKISLMALGSQKLKKVTTQPMSRQGQAACRNQAGYVKGRPCGGGVRRRGRGKLHSRLSVKKTSRDN